jgi:hypothetical protein
MIGNLMKASGDYRIDFLAAPLTKQPNRVGVEQ